MGVWVRAFSLSSAFPCVQLPTDPLELDLPKAPIPQLSDFNTPVTLSSAPLLLYKLAHVS